jgi:glycerol kinase
MTVLSVDAGTSGVRCSIVGERGEILDTRYVEVLPSSPAPGLVEIDATAMANAVLKGSASLIEAHGAVDCVGITNQRASVVLWDAATSKPLGPGIGWQDLRTVGRCLELQAHGFRFAPNASATKLEYLIQQARAHPDGPSPNRWRAGTLDTWIAWVLSKGESHVTDVSNAGVTGLLSEQAHHWREDALEALSIDVGVLPALVPSSGPVGVASALHGSPPISGMAGDQQASLFGQGCIRPGQAKATFGTGAMLDMCLGDKRPEFSPRGPAGTVPIVAWKIGPELTWGLEALMLSAGSNIEWLRDDVGLISDAAQSSEIAAGCEDTGGVFYVPALFGLGTPVWDFGARAMFTGITRGTTKAQLVRAVLEGIAHRAADLLEAVTKDSGMPVAFLRVDGGMTANEVFLQALADATGVPVEVSPALEATTLGAAYLAGIAAGVWNSQEETAALFSPRLTKQPLRALDREGFLAARERARRTIPELSDLEF